MKNHIPVSLLILFAAACGTPDIRNAGYDFLKNDKTIHPDSLQSTLSLACETWQRCPWKDSYKDRYFLEYVLPPRIASEPVEYYWREDIPDKLAIERSDSDRMLTVAAKINRKITINTDPSAWKNPTMGYSATISGRFGKCDDRAILAAMAMRSMGIPAAFEFVPNWGSNNNGHSFCSVILPDDSVAVFQDVNDNGDNALLSQKAPKIYRRMYSLQMNTPLYKYRKTEELPSLFQDFRIMDVTACHRIGKQQVGIAVPETIGNKITYLSVFHPHGWIPVAYTENRGKNTLFENVGDGSNMNGFESAKGENIGNGIVYLPSVYTDKGVIPCGRPVIVSDEGQRLLAASEEQETVRLTRKYPRLIRVIRFADSMVDGIFECANRPDFSDAVPVFQIADTPLSRMQSVELQTKKAYRYLRYRKPRGLFSIGELQAKDSSGRNLSGETIAPEILMSEASLPNVFDGAPLTYFELPGGLDLWVGLDFGKPVPISRIGFCPRNDDNEISPGDEYELFYWKDRWISLGRQTASDCTLEYTNVPKGALLWLRDLTRGREERPFTYENGIQIWW